MKDIQTVIPGLVLARPDPHRDAPVAVSWFNSPHGKDTLVLMGNPMDTITIPTLQEETDRINEFLRLESEDEQLTWMIRYNDKTIGAVWLVLKDTQYLKSPAFHIMIGDTGYRGKGFGRVIMQEMIDYANKSLKADTLYSRHLVSNKRIAHLNESLGFINDGEPYTDSDGLEFQNVKREQG